jgi:nitroreductase/Pyruvate/2-oxoacid:ferredoxin oxidoreductase delta subunit
MRKNDHIVTIDAEKCVGCGLCVKDCVSGNLELKDGKAYVRDFYCIFCGHCEAICPVHAVTMTGFDDEPEEIDCETRLDPDELMHAIKTRRSIRSFEDRRVPEDVLERIIEAGRYSPTGANEQSIRYYVLDTEKDSFERDAVSFFRMLKSSDDPFAVRLKYKTITDDFFFKGAPLVIVVAAKMPVDGGIAAENMALMAEACGLGVLYSGFFKACCNTCEAIRNRLALPTGFQAVTALVLGYPAVHYKRTVRREPADVIRF